MIMELIQKDGDEEKEGKWFETHSQEETPVSGFRDAQM